MNELVFTLWLLCLLGGPLLAISGYLSFRRIRKMEDTPTARTATAAMGEVELQGYAWPSLSLKAPLHQTEVVAFMVTGYRENKSSDIAHQVFRFVSTEPFFLADDRGLTMIKLQTNDEIHGASKVQFWNQLREPTKSELWRRISLAFPSINQEILSGISLVETVLDVGSRIYVHGQMTPELDTDRKMQPAAGVAEFMLAERKKLVIEFIKNRKQLLTQDAPWAKTFLAEKNQLARIPTENPWTSWNGVVRAKPESPLFIGNQWEAEMKSVIGTDYLTRIIVGGVLFAIGILPVIMMTS